jgi:glycerate 2-kinase
MKLVVCPDSFKGSLTSVQAVEAIERGVRKAMGTGSVEIVKIPLADGGEGTVDALVRATGGELRRVAVMDPLLRKTEATFGVLGDATTAVIEMASASGLCLLSDAERNPLVASTYGTGELLLAAVETGARKVIVGIGGSATNDGGAGAMAALGVRFLDGDGRDLPPGGAALARLARIDASGLRFPRNNVEVEVACDVRNPLCGPEGASAVFGPQKGATAQMVAQLDAALRHYADVAKRDLGVEIADLPGAGAAGGLGAGLAAFLGAQLRSGIDIVLDVVGFNDAVRGADWVITGEGALDQQTPYGKVISGVLKRSRAAGVRVVALAGSVSGELDALYDMGLTSAFSIVPGLVEPRTAMRQASLFLESTAERVARLLAG